MDENKIKQMRLGGDIYQELAMYTANKAVWSSELNMLIESAMGIAGEAGEFADLVKKVAFQGHEIDKSHMAKELGDIAWYLALGCEVLGYSFGEILEMNVRKLHARYPNGFSVTNSEHRNPNDV